MSLTRVEIPERDSQLHTIVVVVVNSTFHAASKKREKQINDLDAIGKFFIFEIHMAGRRTETTLSAKGEKPEERSQRLHYQVKLLVIAELVHKKLLVSL